jgi:DNA-nicking Smr family endonuclease
MRLWAEVARTIEPLVARVADEIEPEPRKPAPPAKPSPPPAARVAQRAAQASAPLAALDRRTFSRVARGILEIDARIDLHGLTQQAAHGRLIRFLKEAQGSGARLVLVITGKGKPDGERSHGEGRGVLRRAVPLWLSAAEMRPFVVGFGEAAVPHGGGGALYVRIRRVR